MSSTKRRTEFGESTVSTSDSGVGPKRPSADSVKMPTLAHARSARSSSSGLASIPCASASARAVRGPCFCSTSATPSRVTAEIVCAVHAAIIICMIAPGGGGVLTG